MKKRLTLGHNPDQNTEPENKSMEMISTGVDGRVRINPYRLGRLFIKRKKFIIGATLAVMIVAVAFSLTMPNLYVSRASILPAGEVDKFSELKSMAGLTNLSGNSDNSPELLPVIINSHLIRDAVAGKKYSLVRDGRTKIFTLPEYYGIEIPDRMRARMEKVTFVSMDNKTGVVTVAVETNEPELSQAVLSEYLNQVEYFNRHKRRSEAKERALYLKEQIAQTQIAMTAVEDSLEIFQKANMDWAFSTDPGLLKEMGRLKREAGIKSQKYLYLTQEYEIAQLDAQKDIPILRILDEPSLPYEKSGPRRSVIVLVSGFVTFLIALLLVAVFDTVKKITKGRDQEEFAQLRRDFEEEFPRSNRVVNRVSKILIKT